MGRPRRDGLAPTITDWQRVTAGSAFMFALHAGVANGTGVMEYVILHDLPPAFAAQLSC